MSIFCYFCFCYFKQKYLSTRIKIGSCFEDWELEQPKVLFTQQNTCEGVLVQV